MIEPLFVIRLRILSAAGGGDGVISSGGEHGVRGHWVGIHGQTGLQTRGSHRR